MLLSAAAAAVACAAAATATASHEGTASILTSFNLHYSKKDLTMYLVRLVISYGFPV